MSLARCVARVVGAVALACAFLPHAAADDAWASRVDRELKRMEVTIAALDQRTPSGGTLVERVLALDARLKVLEKAYDLPPGAVAGKDDLGSLTNDVIVLDTRARKVAAKRDPPKETKVEPKKPEDAGVPKKPEKQAGQWPKSLTFSATAKVVYVHTGGWHETKLESGEIRREFLMDGYEARLGFSLRAKGLMKPVRSATIRVATRLKAPLAERSDVYRVNDVTWNASNTTFDNESYKTWHHHDTWQVSAGIRYILAPRTASMSLDVEAHVVSVTLADGSTVAFEVPEIKTG
jgi:hypothetical protein